MRREKATRLNRETFIYGVSVYRGGRAYAFNRDYYCLPRPPSREEVLAIMSDPEVMYCDTASGHGKFKPPAAKDKKGWTTYFVRLPGPLEWWNLDYDRKHYAGEDSYF